MSAKSDITAHPVVIAALLDQRPVWICMASASLWIGEEEGWQVLRHPKRASRCDGLCEHIPLKQVTNSKVLKLVAALLDSVGAEQSP
jgi:hypothetical protein